METAARVSVHGGHSGQFCNHASDTLEEIVKAYIAQKFLWVGITEHAPALSDDLRYPDEKEGGYSSRYLCDRFGQYMEECRRLQKKYSDEITLYVGVEIETYSGYEEFVTRMLEKYRPDYIVGSVHFVDDISFDYSPQEYNRAVAATGSIDTLYKKYFDLQYNMLQLFKPAVVGHFDLVRIYDRDYRQRLQKPEIAAKILRNLEFARRHDLILDYNLRAITKGADEPYVTSALLTKAYELGIAVVPGDDSHGVNSVGGNIDEGIARLIGAGFDGNWQRPRLY